MNALQIPIPSRSFLHGLTALAAAGFMPTALAKAVADAIDDFGNYTWRAASDPRLLEGPLDASALVLARSSALSDEACGRTR